MRCDSCGRQIPDDEEATFDTTNVPTGPGGRRAYTTTAHIWLCHDCAANRRKTVQLIYWIVGTTLVIGAILAIIGLSTRK